jgi:hypothetical protein
MDQAVNFLPSVAGRDPPTRIKTGALKSRRKRNFSQ